MTEYFGIDFANKDKNIGRCVLHVDAERKVVTPTLYRHKLPANSCIAVDCPFGTTVGFYNLILGKEAEKCEWDKGLKTRHTETWLRNTLWEYKTNAFWRQLDVREPQHYVNQTAHVQPTVGLVIVPAFLDWLRRERQLTTEQLVEARLGKGLLVEAHPRAFLYSIIERIYVHCPDREKVDWKMVLTNVVRYKDKKTVSHLEKRSYVYSILQKFVEAWLWNGYSLADAHDNLLETDHAFDAFLAALTAFAHAQQRTIRYSEAGIELDTVKIEGHIAILRQTGPNALESNDQ